MYLQQDTELSVTVKEALTEFALDHFHSQVDRISSMDQDQQIAALAGFPSDSDQCGNWDQKRPWCMFKYVHFGVCCSLRCT